MKAFSRWVAAGAFMWACAVPATAAEIKVLVAAAMRGVMTDLAPEFERATGNKVAMQFGPVGVLRKEVDGGASFDAILAPKALVDELAKSGKVASGSAVAIARSGLGIIGRADAPKPDISTVEAFKRLMLETKSFSYSKDGAQSAYVDQLFDRLGIAEQMKPKKLAVDSASKAIAGGRSDYGLVVVSALGAPEGFQLVGMLPPEIQNYIDYSGAVAANSPHAQAARTLIELVRSPSSKGLLVSKGMEPAGQR